jgi:choline kinase
MNAIIYAAGRATRLGPEYRDRPKILLEFGGLSLLEWHVRHLAALGLHRGAIVTGHLREPVAALLPALRQRYAVELVEVFNPNFTEGSAISMLASLPEIERAGGSLLLMDGDVLYHEAILRRLIESPHPTVLLIDRDYSTADDDPVLVPVRRGRPFEFKKQWRGRAEEVGESIGFFKVAPADLPALIEETRRRAVGRGRLDSYDEIIRALVRAGRFAREDVTGLPWTEIDFPQDVVVARQKVLPALLAQPASAAPLAGP